MLEQHFELIECFENSLDVVAECKKNSQHYMPYNKELNFEIAYSHGHSHDYYQFVYVVNAHNIILKKNLIDYNLIENIIYLIKPNELHKFILKDDCDYLFYEIKFKTNIPKLKKLIADLPDSIADSDSYEIKQILMDICCEYKNSDFNDDMKYVKLYELILKLNRLALINNSNSIHINPYLESTAVYLPLFQFINENYMNPITLKELADVMKMQKNYFAKQFKKLFNISPMHFVQYIRLDKSVNLLEYTNLSIQEISELVGYEDQNSYAKAFKKMYAVTPTFYRRNAKKVLSSKYK